MLPSGPTVLDEVANGAFWTGLVLGVAHEIGDVTRKMDFDEARSNFITAARRGLNAGFEWFDGESIDAKTLILERLLPMAERSLKKAGVDEEDVSRYLGVIGKRVESGQNGSAWALRSLSPVPLPKDFDTLDEWSRALDVNVMPQRRLAPGALGALQSAGQLTNQLLFGEKIKNLQQQARSVQQEIIFSNAMHVVGLLGAPRRTPLGLAPYIPEEWSGHLLRVGIGGTILFISGVMYVLIVLATALSKQKVDEPVEIPEAESIHDPQLTPGWLDRWVPWLVGAIALILIAYGPQLVDQISNISLTSPGFMLKAAALKGRTMRSRVK